MLPEAVLAGVKGDIAGLKEGIAGMKGDIPGLKDKHHRG